MAKVVDYIQASDADEAWYKCLAEAAGYGPEARLVDCFYSEELERWVCNIEY